ncbi:MurE-like ligase [Stieleria maiorica]|uniref:MurE-like ligase n=1 Tax=Stieleria maiorica TaxID=2795974 RepID=A0A5B9MFC9_9BACT|nr:hypothetical protein [Stieleria maiorica]QEF99941.1 MurE-like ligase [Stieleria maiorica]
MRHAFDVRQSVSFRTLLGEDSVNKELALLPKLSSTDVPPMTSVSIDTFADEVDQPISISLAELFPEAKFFGCKDVCLSTLAEDVHECGPGDVVTYRVGEGDPNELISDALARGAGGILTEQLLPCPLPQCIVGSVDHALARITSAKHQHPDRKLLTVGVLGNSGKTSTCLLAATLTKALGIRTAYQCDLGASDGVVNETPAQAVPHGAPLIDWIAESGDCLSRIAIIEIDETAARDGHYDALQFDVLMVTGKRELSDDFGPCGLQCLMERLTPTGIVIAPGEDTKTVRVLEESRCQSIFYGTTAESEFGAIMIDQSGGMATLMLTAGDTSAMMETPLCGKSMASNIAAASALGALLGHSPHEIAKHLSTLRSIPGRGQRLVDFGHATVVLETGGTVDRVRAALRTAKAVGAGGRVWCVLAIGEADDAELLASYGHVIERFAHHCVVASRPEHSGAFLQRSHQLLDGVKKCAAIRLVVDQQKALQWAIESSRARDTIVVITNDRAQPAHQSRTEMAALEQWVAAARTKKDAEEEAAAEADPTADVGAPIKLKLFR